MSTELKTGRFEKVLIRLTLWATLPLLTGIICWWTAAAVSIYGVLPLTEEIVKHFAIGGLAAGFLAFLLFQRTITANFYLAKIPVVVAVYCFCTVFAFAMAMGVPVLVPLPGIVLGLYSGRRLAHAAAGLEEAIKQAKNTAYLAAGVTGLAGAGSILMAALDNSLASNIGRMLGVDWTRGTILGGAVILLPVLIAVQYLLTKWAVRLAIGRL